MKIFFVTTAVFAFACSSTFAKVMTDPNDLKIRYEQGAYRIVDDLGRGNVTTKFTLPDEPSQGLLLAVQQLNFAVQNKIISFNDIKSFDDKSLIELSKKVSGKLKPMVVPNRAYIEDLENEFAQCKSVELTFFKMQTDRQSKITDPGAAAK